MPYGKDIERKAITLRVPASLYRRLRIAAEEAGISMAGYILMTVSQKTAVVRGKDDSDD